MHQQSRTIPIRYFQEHSRHGSAVEKSQHGSAVSYYIQVFSLVVCPWEILPRRIPDMDRLFLTTVLNRRPVYRGGSLPLRTIPDMDQLTRTMPRGRLQHFRRLVTYLGNQNEDCLNLNLYVPMTHTTAGM